MPFISAWNVSLVLTNPFLGTFLKSEKKIFFKGKSEEAHGNQKKTSLRVPQILITFFLCIQKEKKKDHSKNEFHTQGRETCKAGAAPGTQR